MYANADATTFKKTAEISSTYSVPAASDLDLGASLKGLNKDAKDF